MYSSASKTNFKSTLGTHDTISGFMVPKIDHWDQFKNDHQRINY